MSQRASELARTKRGTVLDNFYFSRLTAETVTNYEVVSPVVRFKSDDLSAEVGPRD